MPIVGNPIIVGTQKSGGGDDPFALTNYIESSGTQWIDIEYVPTQNSRYEFVATFLSGNPAYSMIVGARDVREGADGNPVIFGPGNSSFQIGWGTRTLTSGINSTPFVNLKGVYIFDKDGYDASVESKRPSGYGIYSGAAPLTTNSLYLFSLNAAGSEYGADTRCKAKLYRFRIYENSTLVHEFTPWQENGVACLKDTVTGNLKYNAGTGNFAYGTDA